MSGAGDRHTTTGSGLLVASRRMEMRLPGLEIALPDRNRTAAAELE
jgi:hypothetical protein